MHMTSFRSISLCNVVYKLVSKVLANRPIFLSKIVSINQSAFTLGRLITDNILVAFELFHHMKQLKSTEGCMAMKSLICPNLVIEWSGSFWMLVH